MIEEFSQEYPVSYICPRVTIKKGRCDGLPCVRGTEITTKSIAILAHNGATQEEVLDQHPELEMDDLKDVYVYYQGPYKMFTHLELDYEEKSETVYL